MKKLEFSLHLAERNLERQFSSSTLENILSNPDLTLRDVALIYRTSGDKVFVITAHPLKKNELLNKIRRQRRVIKEIG